MSHPVFISYSHRQSEWVHERLAPAVRASGIPVFLDAIDSKAGLSLDAQMKRWVDESAHVVAVLSPDYLKSVACKLEWSRAMARDPGFLKGGILVPVLRESCDPMPPKLRGTKAPLYLDLRTDDRSKHDATLERQWQKLLEVWGGNLGTRIVDWLDALHGIRRDLAEAKHVSVLATAPIKWSELIVELQSLLPEPAAVVNLGDPVNWSRPDFLENILTEFGIATRLDRSTQRSDIVGFSKAIHGLPPRRLVLKNFHKCKRFEDFGADLFDALRFHSMDEGRNLTLMVHTTEPFGGLLPPGHLLSVMTANHISLAPRHASPTY